MASLIDNINKTGSLVKEAYNAVETRGGILPEVLTLTNLINAILSIEGGSVSLDTLNKYFDNVFSGKDDNTLLAMIRIKTTKDSRPEFKSDPIVYSKDNDAGYTNILYKTDNKNVYANDLFESYDNTTDIILSPDVDTIDNMAFSSIRNNISISSMSPILHIGNSAFEKSRSNINIDNLLLAEVQTIGNRAFLNFDLKNSNFIGDSGSIISIGSDAFSKANNYKIKLSRNTLYIGSNAFINLYQNDGSIIFEELQYKDSFNGMLAGIEKIDCDKTTVGLETIDFSLVNQYPVEVFGTLNVDKISSDRIDLQNIPDDFKLFTNLQPQKKDKVRIDLTPILTSIFKNEIIGENIKNLKKFLGGVVDTLIHKQKIENGELLLNSYVANILKYNAEFNNIYNDLIKSNWTINIPDESNIPNIFNGIITSSDICTQIDDPDTVLNVHSYNTIYDIADYTYDIYEYDSANRKNIAINLDHEINTTHDNHDSIKITIKFSDSPDEVSDEVSFEDIFGFDAYIRTNVYDYVRARKLYEYKYEYNKSIINIFYAFDNTIVITYDANTINAIDLMFISKDEILTITGIKPLIKFDIHNLANQNIEAYIESGKNLDAIEQNPYINGIHDICIGGAKNITYFSDQYKDAFGEDPNITYIAYNDDNKLQEKVIDIISNTLLYPVDPNRLSEGSHLYMHYNEFSQDPDVYIFNNTKVIDDSGMSNVEYNLNNRIISYKFVISGDDILNKLIISKINAVLVDIFESDDYTVISDINVKNSIWEPVYNEYNNALDQIYGKGDVFEDADELIAYISKENRFDFTSIDSIIGFLKAITPKFDITFPDGSSMEDHCSFNSNIGDLLEFIVENQLPDIHTAFMPNKNSIKLTYNLNEYKSVDYARIVPLIFNDELPLLSEHMSLIIDRSILEQHIGTENMRVSIKNNINSEEISLNILEKINE